MNGIETLVCPDAPEPSSWPNVEAEMQRRLIFWKLGVQYIRSQGLRPTQPEAQLYKRQKQLLNRLPNSIEGINVERAEKFISNQGLRIAPFRLLNEPSAQMAKAMEELKDKDGSYAASYDVALVPRLANVEAMHGPEFTESILVHELAHGTNTYHDLFYIEDITNNKRNIWHGRSGQRVYDCDGAERGRILEEAYAEQQRGKYVAEVLHRPFGFTRGIITAKYLRQGDAIVASKYAALRTDGKVHLMAESFGAQALDLLCRVDPGLEEDLRLARHTADGLRNVAKRLNRVQPGLYAYMRNLPHQRKNYRDCLIRVQQLVGLVQKTKSPT